MDHLTLLLKLGIFTDRKYFRPAHQVIRVIYAGPICWLLQIGIQKVARDKVSVFPRRSSSESASTKNFNCFFSDLDIGICVNPDTDILTIRNIHHKIKKILPFLGELEIYFPRELHELNEFDEKTTCIYKKLRDFRKINWIKNQLTSSDRHLYHRYKDHRALKIIKKKYGWSSFAMENAADIIANELQIKIPLESVFSDSLEAFFCPYLSTKIKLQSNSTSSNKTLFLMSCTPPRFRDNNFVNSIIEKMRSQSVQIDSIFRELTRYEYLIASAFIRGAKHSEPWHETWMSKLSE